MHAVSEADDAPFVAALEPQAVQNALQAIEEREWNARLFFRPLRLVREPGRRPVVGCPEVKTFLELEDDGVLAIEAIGRHVHLKDAHAYLVREHGVDLDLREFARFLVQKGFVARVNQIPVNTKEIQKRRKTFLANVPQGAVAWMHSPFFLATILTIVAAGIAAMIRHPEGRPTFQDVQIFDSPGLVLGAGLAFMLTNAFVHELAHLFMARGFGIDSSISVSRRFHIIVLQTDVTNAWTLRSKASRCLIFLAGMGYNLAFMAACVIYVTLGRQAIVPLPARGEELLMFAAYMNTIPLRFQFLLWIRTDLYYVLMTLFGHRLLVQDSRRFLAFYAKRFGRVLVGTPAEPCQSCGARTYIGEPQCLRCGDRLKQLDDTTLPFQHNSRGLLATYGISAYLFLPVFLLVALQGIALGSFGIVTDMGLAIIEDVATRNWFSLLDDGLVALMLILQVTMVAVFAGPALVKRMGGMMDGLWRGFDAGRLFLPLIVSGLGLVAAAMIARHSRSRRFPQQMSQRQSVNPLEEGRP